MLEWLKGQRIRRVKFRDYYLGFCVEVIAEDVNGLNFKDFYFTSFNLKEFDEQVQMLKERFYT